MPSIKRLSLLTGAFVVGLAAMAGSWVVAQERLPWQSGQPAPYQGGYGGQGYGQQPPPEEPYPPSQQPYSGGDYRQNDLPPPSGGGRSSDAYRSADPYRQEDPRVGGRPPVADAYRPQGQGSGGGGRVDDAYRPPQPYNADQGAPPQGGFVDNYRRGRPYGANQPPPGPPRDDAGSGYGAPYTPAPQAGEEQYDREYERGAPLPPRERGPGYANDGGTYSKNEIMSAGHSFFGSISSGLASVIEHAFQQSGRPNGYILGEDAGGAFVAGLRYGEGVLHTKDAGNHRVYWQGPSLGYDFGAEGSKTMVLVYNLRDPQQIYDRFGGVQGSAYIVGGVSIQFQKNEDVVLAPIRAGVGLRLGANIGYLKYTRTPTWNPF